MSEQSIAAGVRVRTPDGRVGIVARLDRYLGQDGAQVMVGGRYTVFYPLADLTKLRLVEDQSDAEVPE